MGSGSFGDENIHDWGAQGHTQPTGCSVALVTRYYPEALRQPRRRGLTRIKPQFQQPDLGFAAFDLALQQRQSRGRGNRFADFTLKSRVS